MSSPVRVAFVGNIANNFFREVSALQDSKLIKADLFLYQDENTPNTEFPESDAPGLVYPDWIEFLPAYRWATYAAVLSSYPLLKAWNKSIDRVAEQLDRYDLCVFSGPELLLLPFLKTKTLFRATGSDLTMFPVMSPDEFFSLRPKGKPDWQRGFLSSLKKIVEFYVRRKAYRNAIRKATYLQGGFQPYDWAFDRLKRVNGQPVSFLRLAIDTDRFKRSREKAEVADKRWGLSDKEFIVFMPSRVMLRESSLHRATGQWKGSDQAILGFKKLIEMLGEEAAEGVVLVLPDRTRSDDLDAAKQLVDQLSISDHVQFVKGNNAGGLTRSELITLYSRADVVMDDFGAGWYGSVVVESLSCGCPTVSYVRDTDMRNISPWHPIQVARFADDIADTLHRLHNDADLRSQVGKKSREWIKQYHSSEAIKAIYEREIPSL